MSFLDHEETAAEFILPSLSSFTYATCVGLAGPVKCDTTGYHSVLKDPSGSVLMDVTNGMMSVGGSVDGVSHYCRTAIKRITKTGNVGLVEGNTLTSDAQYPDARLTIEFDITRSKAAPYGSFGWRIRSSNDDAVLWESGANSDGTILHLPITSGGATLRG